jgi:hypothetical protein
MHLPKIVVHTYTDGYQHIKVTRHAIHVLLREFSGGTLILLFILLVAGHNTSGLGINASRAMSLPHL